MKKIMNQHDQFLERHSSSGVELTVVSCRVLDRLSFHALMLRSLKARARSNEQRLQNEITLVSLLSCRVPVRTDGLTNESKAFNSIAQYDSKTAVKISRATQIDSAAMRTVAVLTLAFLPATFISVSLCFCAFYLNSAPSDEPIYRPSLA